MDQLGRYPLSVILSFLTETEGTSLLITKKRYAHQLLPIFRLPKQQEDELDGLRVNVDPKRKRLNRHTFIVSPVQDPIVLLERLNTKRLFRRKRLRPCGSCRRHSRAAIPVGLTTAELAAREWHENFQHKESSLDGGNHEEEEEIPPELELLRFLRRQNPVEDDIWRNCGTSVLVSYPRSGNTLVRTLLERTTCLVTGSDTRPDRSLSRQLAEQYSLVGEGVTGSLVPFVKTHWPERVGNAVYTARRAVLVVRNPFDAIDSYWNMNATKSHTETVSDSVYQQFQEKFQGLVKNEIHMWLRFHHYWLNEVQKQQAVPVLIVRFEDLIRDTLHELTRIMKFVLQSQELSPEWKCRVVKATGGKRSSQPKQLERLGSYVPRTAAQGASSVGKSLQKNRYSTELLQYIHEAAAQDALTTGGTNFLQLFGYDMDTQGFPENFKKGQVQENTESRNTSEIDATNRGSTTAVVRVNAGTPVRPVDCPYGRLMQTWRHSVTKNDTEPLPTVPPKSPA